MYYGEVSAHRVVEAVLRSPAWPRTLLIYTYDEHGGYYDHVLPRRQRHHRHGLLDVGHAAFAPPPTIEGPSLTGPSGPAA